MSSCISRQVALSATVGNVINYQLDYSGLGDNYSQTLQRPDTLEGGRERNMPSASTDLHPMSGGQSFAGTRKKPTIFVHSLILKCIDSLAKRILHSGPGQVCKRSLRNSKHY
jgi:hypothetical protein